MQNLAKNPFFGGVQVSTGYAGKNWHVAGHTAIKIAKQLNADNNSVFAAPALLAA